MYKKTKIVSKTAWKTIKIKKIKINKYLMIKCKMKILIMMMTTNLVKVMKIKNYFIKLGKQIPRKKKTPLKSQNIIQKIDI